MTTLFPPDKCHEIPDFCWLCIVSPWYPVVSPIDPSLVIHVHHHSWSVDGQVELGVLLSIDVFALSSLPSILIKHGRPLGNPLMVKSSTIWLFNIAMENPL